MINHVIRVFIASALLFGFALVTPQLHAQESLDVKQKSASWPYYYYGKRRPLSRFRQRLERDFIRELRRKPRSNVSLTVFDCGTVQINELGLFGDRLAGRMMEVANPCYYIEHPRKGGLIWDTGLSDLLVGLPPQPLLGGAIEVSVENTFLDQMTNAGIDPSRVRRMAISHLHFDHTGNMRYFPQAQWLIQKPEFELAFSEGAVAAGFNPADYDFLSRHQAKLLRGHHDVFGDGSVIILSTPGHSIGHQVLLVKLKETGPVILSGDLYHFQENRDNYELPGINEKKSSVRSFAFIDQVLDVTGAELWLQHDPELFQSLQLAPFAYR